VEHFSQKLLTAQLIGFIAVKISSKDNAICGSIMGEGKTTYTFSISVNTFSIEFPLACYQQAGRVWYISRALRRTYTLFYSAPSITERFFPIKQHCQQCQHYQC
jgi:hypothetical protein